MKCHYLEINLPTKDAEYCLKIKDISASLSITATYVNHTVQPLELTFALPLPPKFTVQSITATTKNCIKQAIIVSEQNAKAAKEAAKGDNTTMMIENSSNINMIIGFLNPKEEVSVSIKFIITPSISKQCYSLTIPNIASTIPNGDKCLITFNANIKSSTPLTVISSKNHQMTIKILPEGKEATFAYSSSKYSEKPFKILYRNGSMYKPCSQMFKHPLYSEYALSIAYCFSSLPDEKPALNETQYKSIQKCNNELQTREYIFLLDCSGSMSGNSIGLAIKSLTYFLKSLKVGSYFNIIKFGTNMVLIHPESMIVNDSNITSTLGKVKRITADLVQTNILAPLMSAIDSAPKIAKKKIIILLTDGEVNDKDKVLQYIKSNRNKCRVFSIGIGSGVDRDLIEKSAYEGRGKFFIVTSMTDIADNIVESLQNSNEDYICNINVSNSIEGIEFIAQGSSIIATNKLYTYTAVAPTQPKGEFTISWTDSNEKPYTQTLKIPNEPIKSSKIFSIAASEYIKSKDAITDGGSLSEKYDILSKYTALCVHSEQTKPTNQIIDSKVKHVKIEPNINIAEERKQVLRKALIEKTLVVSKVSSDSTIEPNKNIILKIAESNGVGSTIKISSITEQNIRSEAEKDCELYIGSESLDRYMAKNVVDENAVIYMVRLNDIIQLQNAEGYWDSSNDLETLMIRSSDIPQQLTDDMSDNKLQLENKVMKDAYATMFTILRLKANYAKSKGKWAQIMKKAKEWLKDHKIIMANMVKTVQFISQLLA